MPAYEELLVGLGSTEHAGFAGRRSVARHLVSDETLGGHA
jgi:hypothetical protein